MMNLNVSENYFTIGISLCTVASLTIVSLTVFHVKSSNWEGEDLFHFPCFSPSTKHQQMGR